MVSKHNVTEYTIQDVSDDANARKKEKNIFHERREKLNFWRTSGNAYPNKTLNIDRIHLLRQDFNNLDNVTLQKRAYYAHIAGRLMLKRIMGKSSFATVQDENEQLQIYIASNEITDAQYEEFKTLDLGDIISAEGIVFRTKTGELSIRCKKILLLSKALRPLPEKFHGLLNKETCYRQRYLDLLVNIQTRQVFACRFKIISSIRRMMEENNFLEVETPMLHPIPGGATAKPFVTYHNALEMSMYLRIAPELYLKRLIVAGFNKVFELNRNFRNEGLSVRHNPEFTMMEFYAAYTDYHWMMNFTEKLLKELTIKILGSSIFKFDEKIIDFNAPFKRLSIIEAILLHQPQHTEKNLKDLNYLKSILIDSKIDLKERNLQNAGIGALQLAYFEETVEKKLWNPTFIVDYPAEVSPLARYSDHNSEITERFELFVAGKEIANGFSELNDPDDQAERFKKQVEKKDAGDLEAMYYDADYIRALEYGMPPTSGCGIGIDRLVMLMTNQKSIRDVLLFPHLRK